MTELLLCSRRCDECLFTPDRIVPSSKASKIIAECLKKDNHFICHLGTLNGQIIHCRGYYDSYRSRVVRFAESYGIPIVEINPEEIGGPNV